MCDLKLSVSQSRVVKMEEEPELLTARHRVRGGRTKRKQLLTDEVKVEDLRANWSQCMFLMVHKRRLCNVSRCPESMYCGNHRPAEEGAGWRVLKEAADKQVDFGRIPCPVDPTHSIYRHNLTSHTIRCTIRKGQDSMQFLPYYQQDCNSGEPISSNLPIEYCMEIGSTMSVPDDNAAHVETPTLPVCPDLLYEKIARCFRQLEQELGLRPQGDDNGNDGDKGAGGVVIGDGGLDDDNYLLNDGAPCEDDEMSQVPTHPNNPSSHSLPPSHTSSPFLPLPHPLPSSDPSSLPPPPSPPPQAEYAELEGIVVRALSGRQTAFDRVRLASPHVQPLLRYPCMTHLLISHPLIIHPLIMHPPPHNTPSHITLPLIIHPLISPSPS